MTNREKEILEIIRNNPLISQKELAVRLGITRSSVAGHIMNLIGKGLISGKGYILNKSSYALVIGAANMDIQGYPDDLLIQKDSNPGRIKISCGGVGRNIAENMARLGLDVKLLTILGGDSRGKQLMEESESAGVDMSHVLHLPERSSSTYLSILNERGDMALAVSDMEMMDSFPLDYIRSKNRLIRNASLILLDANLPSEIISYLAETYRDIPLFADTVSTAKAPRIKKGFPYIHTIKPNGLEAECLTGLALREEKDMEEAARRLLKEGVKQVIISRGEEGIYYRSQKEEVRLANPVRLPGKMVNATGAGDAFMAGLAYGQMEGFSTRKTLQFAQAAAALTLCHENTINPNMSIKSINTIIRENYYED